jgi:pimeloyl-ACP methyl ester carboxylesterase
MPSIQVNGTELFYVDEGAGQPIVFVPGLGATHDLWGRSWRRTGRATG